MSRSLKVQQAHIERVKLALRRNGYPSQRALAEEVGLALATVSNFLTGKPIDFANFEELCRQLALDWKEICDLDFDTSTPKSPPKEPQPDLLEDISGFAPPYPSGVIPLDSPFYLKRTPLEEQIAAELQKPGALVRIRAPQEMGKTSLLLRILDFAQTLDYQTVIINLEQADQAILNDLNQFLRWLCANVARQLNLKSRLDEYWDADLGSKISCTAYFEDYLLSSLAKPLVLALDELQQIFEHRLVAKDFLPLLRSWYEEAKTNPIWRKLRLIIVHSTEIYIPLQLNQSPFNVGLPVQPGPFSLEEVQRLALQYGLDWQGETEAKQLMNLVGGHPALIQIALYHLARQEQTLSQLLENATTNSGVYAHHLQRHWVILEEQPELASTLNLVMSATEGVVLDPLLAHKLSSMGWVKQVGDKVLPSCELYRQSYLKKFN